MTCKFTFTQDGIVTRYGGIALGQNWIIVEFLKWGSYQYVWIQYVKFRVVAIVKIDNILPWPW